MPDLFNTTLNKQINCAAAIFLLNLHPISLQKQQHEYPFQFHLQQFHYDDDFDDDEVDDDEYPFQFHLQQQLEYLFQFHYDDDFDDEFESNFTSRNPQTNFAITGKAIIHVNLESINGNNDRYWVSQ